VSRGKHRRKWRLPGGYPKELAKAAEERSDRRRDGPSLVLDLSPGEAQHLIPEELQSCIAPAILLECGAGAVRLPSIHFDDQAVRQRKSTSNRSTWTFHLWLRKSMAANEGKEPFLQFGTGPWRYGRARPPLSAVGSVADRQAKKLGFPNGGGEFRLREDGTQIRESASGSGHRDPVAPGAIGWRKRGRSMEPYTVAACPATIRRDGHIDGSGSNAFLPRKPARAAADTPQLGRAPMAQHGTIAAGENRRHPSSFRAQTAMPDRINTAMNAVKAAGADAIRNSARQNAAGDELRSRDHAVLPGGNMGNRPFWGALGDFVRHIRTKSTTPLISPPSLPVFGAPRG
jgi:hypothetical protein